MMSEEEEEVLYHIRDMRFEAKELIDRTGTGYPEFEVVAYCGRVLRSNEDYWMTVTSISAEIVRTARSLAYGF